MFYNSAEWRALRAEKLRRNPVCEVAGCGHRVFVVDHVRSIRSGRARLDIDATKAMCWSHHSQKTCRVDGGFGRTPDPIQRGCDVKGLPLDPGHRWRATKP